MVDAGTWLNSTQTGNTFNQNAGTINAAGTFTVTSGRFNFNGGTATGDVGVYNGQLAVANTVTQTATIGAFGGSSVLVNNLSPVVTVWVQGRSMFGDAILNLSSAATNAGAILLKSTDGAWRSDINTGTFTLTNSGTLTSSLGSGGERVITGTLDNKATIAVDPNSGLAISGVYDAAGGTIAGPGYLINCQIEVTASPASPTTLLVVGQSDTLMTDNLPNTILWVQGNNTYGTGLLTTVAGVTNHGTILLQSAGNTSPSNVTSASGPLQNGADGILDVGLGSGGGRAIVGDVDNAGLIEFTGGSPLALSVTGNYTQETSGTLSVRVAGSGQYDQLVVTGKATLDGTLTASLLNGFVPKPGDVYKFLTHASRAGTFAQLNLPTGTALRVIYNNTDTDLEL